MPKALKEVQFKEVPGSVEEALPELYQSLNIEFGIDDAAVNIRRHINEDKSVSFVIPERKPKVNIDVVLKQPESGMLQDQQKADEPKYVFDVQPSEDKTQRFLLFPKTAQVPGQAAEEDVKPYVVEVREDGKVYVSEDTVEDYGEALNRQLIVDQLIAKKDQPARNEKLESENISFNDGPDTAVIATRFPADSIVRVNNRYGRLLYDRDGDDEDIIDVTDPLAAAMNDLDDGIGNSTYITVKGEDGNETVYLAQKRDNGYYVFNESFKQIPENHNADIDDDDPRYEQLTAHMLPTKRAAMEDAIYHFDRAVCVSADGKIMTREEVDAELVKKDGRFIVLPPDGSRPRWAVNKDGQLQISKPFNEKVSFTDEDFTELGPVTDPATLSKLALPEGAYARDGEGRVYREQTSASQNVIKEADELPKKMADFLSTGKHRLMVYDRPGAKPYLLECVNGVLRKSKPLDVQYEYDDKDLDPAENKYKLGQLVDPQQVSFAVDINGKVYDGFDNIAKGLEKPDTMLFIYNKDFELPYAVMNKEGRFLISDQPVSAQTQLPGSSFEAKKSLDPRDIINITSRREYQTKKDIWEDMAKWGSKSSGADEAIRKGKKLIESFEKKEPKSPDEPEKPRFGAGSRIWRGIVKFFTIGRGETQAYIKYQRDLADYMEETLPEYEKEFQEYEKKHKDWEERLQGYRDNIDFYKQQKEKLKTVLPQLEEEKNEAFRNWNKVNGNNDTILTSYKNHTEVFLEGVSDLMKNGLNTNNLFAYARMAEGNCMGKTLKDPDAAENLSAFVAAKMAEETINHDVAVNSAPDNGAHSRMCEQIANGKAMTMIAQDPDYQKILEEIGDGPISPYSVYSKYSDKVMGRSNKKDVQAQHEYAMNKLKDSRQALVDNFGKQPLSVKSLDDIMRLTAYDAEISYNANNMRLGSKDAGDKIISINGANPANAPEVRSTQKFGNNAKEVIKAMMENEKVAYQEMEKLSASAKSPAEKRMFDNMRNQRYRTTIEPMPRNNKNYSEILPTLVTRTPAGEKVEPINPDDERINNGTFEPGKSYVVTVKPVYTLEQMKEMYMGFQKKLDQPQAQNNGPQAGGSNL